MADAARRTAPSLLVFSDDWGRHPSSCQHLIGELLPQHPVCWVNTIGMRTPKLDRETFRRAWGKVTQWAPGRSAAKAVAGETAPADSSRQPQVLNPRMWPWFTRRIDRAVNRRLLERQLRSAVEALPQPVVALTTLPITADLVGRLPVASWVYYCVDDFREWPGLDGKTLGRMEEDLVQKADEIIVVSDTLRERMRSLGRDARLLTHGCDLSLFVPNASLFAPPLRKGGQGGSGGVALADADLNDSPKTRLQAPHPHLAHLEPPYLLFWGVIDRRMDTQFLRHLSASLNQGTIVLVGPQQNPDPDLLATPRVVVRPPVPMRELPALAEAASVLLMPYADLPVTRAMQPLKLKEYLATGKPAVVRNLPATADWADSLDAVSTPREFTERVQLRLLTGLPESQRFARRRLEAESWSAKAAQLDQWLCELLPDSRSHGDCIHPCEAAVTGSARLEGVTA